MQKSLTVIADKRGLWASKEAESFADIVWAKKFESVEGRVILATREEKIIKKMLRRKDVIFCGYHPEKYLNIKNVHKPACVMVHSMRDVQRFRGKGNVVFFHQAMFQYANPVAYMVPIWGEYVFCCGTKKKNHMLAKKNYRPLKISTNPKYKGEFPKQAEVHYHSAPDQYLEFLNMMAMSRLVVIPNMIPKDDEITPGVTSAVDAITLGKWIITTKGSGLEDYVVDGQNGFLVEPDPDAIDEAVENAWDLRPENHLKLTYVECLKSISKNIESC